MSGQDRKGPINLLQQHDSYELMGPGRSPEGEAQVRLLAQHLSKAFGTADDEKNVGASGIVPGTQPARESLAGNIVAASVKRRLTAAQ